MPTKILEEVFGALHNGETIIKKYTLQNESIEVSIINYGATITSIKVPDAHGIKGDVVLGYDTLEEYTKNIPYIGCTIGRFANRIANAKFYCDGVLYDKLYANDGPNTLHGGKEGFNKKIYTTVVDDSAVTMTYKSVDGEEGFPGNLTLNVKYSLTDNNGLKIDYNATTDKATPCNITNHSYFNLSGMKEKDVYNHSVQILCDEYTPAVNNIPTGQIVQVTGPFDLRKPKLMGDMIKELPELNGYDNNYCVKGWKEIKRDIQLVARVRHNESGRRMNVYTTQAGLQFYTGNHLDNVGKNHEKAVEKMLGKLYNRLRSSKTDRVEPFKDSSDDKQKPRRQLPKTPEETTRPMGAWSSIKVKKVARSSWQREEDVIRTLISQQDYQVIQSRPISTEKKLIDNCEITVSVTGESPKTRKDARTIEHQHFKKHKKYRDKVHVDVNLPTINEDKTSIVTDTKNSDNVQEDSNTSNNETLKKDAPIMNGHVERISTATEPPKPAKPRTFDDIDWNYSYLSNSNRKDPNAKRPALNDIVKNQEDEFHSEPTLELLPGTVEVPQTVKTTSILEERGRSRDRHRQVRIAPNPSNSSPKRSVVDPRRSAMSPTRTAMSPDRSFNNPIKSEASPDRYQAPPSREQVRRDTEETVKKALSIMKNRKSSATKQTKSVKEQERVPVLKRPKAAKLTKRSRSLTNNKVADCSSLRTNHTSYTSMDNLRSLSRDVENVRATGPTGSVVKLPESKQKTRPMSAPVTPRTMMTNERKLSEKVQKNIDNVRAMPESVHPREVENRLTHLTKQIRFTPILRISEPSLTNRPKSEPAKNLSSTNRRILPRPPTKSANENSSSSYQRRRVLPSTPEKNLQIRSQPTTPTYELQSSTRDFSTRRLVRPSTSNHNNQEVCEKRLKLEDLTPLLNYLKLVRDCPREYVKIKQAARNHSGLQGITFQTSNLAYIDTNSLVVQAAYEVGSQRQSSATLRKYPDNRKISYHSQQFSDQSQDLSNLERAKSIAEMWLNGLSSAQAIRAKDLALEKLSQSDKSVRETEKFCRYFKAVSSH
ncbi:DgyrCDS7677 [Dimorphilus gyrociliatus]|uniref:Galactose mutarotase n=1 Tax=Dimorphilus gyrociliatus TaxID=2664684 RepID=A0A7I8VTJ1_9ANNE|nr:DgyrCDS7677 [Dimorphilus gyrociliatus]